MTATTRTCPKCSSAVASDSKFCPSCGTAVSGIFSGGGSPLEGTAVLGVEQVDTLFPILQEATLGDYDIYGELGRGGMAAVYLALDLSLNRKVAIKTMLPDLVSRAGMVDRFKREAQTAAALSHPHIIQIFSVKDTKRLVYFVMKYIEGRSLESVIIERGKLDVDLTRVILSQVGGALAFAHRKGVVHRDMKPANIMLEEDGWAIVTDFGIAKVQEAQNLTATGTAIGTPHYMSPEQFHNKAVTGASDQYSLGIVAYEMLTGRKPFDGATYAEIITQHLFEPPPDLRAIRPDIPDNVAEAISRMMTKEASARFPDLDAAVAALGQATTTQGHAARTQMISLAKSGPEKKVRMSVPQSPIPLQRKPAAATVVEGRPSDPPTPAKKKPAAKPAEKSKAPMWIGLAATIVALAAGGFFGAKQLGLIGKPAVEQAGQSIVTQAPVAAAPQTPVVDSSTLVAEPPPADTKVAAAPESKAVPEKPVLDRATKRVDTKTAAVTKTAGPAGSTPTKANDTKTVAADKPAAMQVEAPPKEEAKPSVPATRPIQIGTRTADAILFVNGASDGVLPSNRTISVRIGEVKLLITAEKCTKWDTTFTVTAGAEPIIIGRKNLTCS